MSLKEISTVEIETSEEIPGRFLFLSFILAFIPKLTRSLFKYFQDLMVAVSLTILKFITSTQVYLCSAVNIVWIFLQLVLLTFKG